MGAKVHLVVVTNVFLLKLKVGGVCFDFFWDKN